MEKKILENPKDLNLATVLREVQSVKTALEVKNLKEQIIASVLRVEDVKVLEKIAKVICEANSRSITLGEGTSGGNE
jgi:hypothetical protein